MDTPVSVIVSKCVTPDSPSFRRAGNSSYGDRLVDEKVGSVNIAKALGNRHRAKGMSVVVRPNYNETDADGTFFREWRSFNGEPFKEVRFGTGF